MKIIKKELLDRMFIPYQMIITIESEKEQENLTKALRSYDARHSHFLFGGDAISELLKLILNHVK